MDRIQHYLDGLLRARSDDPKTLRFIARAKEVIESDSWIARTTLSLVIAVASAFTGVASVAGLAAAFVEREAIYALIVVITASMISAISDRLASGQGRHRAGIKRVRVEVKLAYRTTIQNSGLCP